MMLFERVRRGAGKVAWSLVTLWVVVALVLATVLAGFMVLYNDRQELIHTNQALIDQVRGAGEKPVVESPSEVVQGQAGSPGARGERGPQGLPGERGQTGPQGPRGETGPPGTDGKDGAAGAAGSAGARGADGDDSTVPGPAGAAGAPGADSTVPGPVGPAGPAGPTGPAGAPGAAGQPGIDGRSVSSVQCVMDGAGTSIVFYDQTGAEIGRVSSVCSPAN